MGETLNQMLENYLASSKVQFQKGPNSISFTLKSEDGISRTSLYQLLPYTHLIFFDIHAKALPGETAKNAGFHPLQFNYCISGRIELLLEDRSYIYLKENDFCISRQTSQNESCFPTKSYCGITLYFDPGFFSEANQTVAELFEWDLSRLSEMYFQKKDTYIAEAGREMQALFHRLWQFYEAPASFPMKLCVLELLHLLLDEKTPPPEKSLPFYTSLQVEIAKKAEQLLTADLKRHIPVREIARQFGISETSLKNYFRGVYGKNVSDYLRELRMRTAERLLTETTLPISEIASLAGYTKQGKFAEVFRSQYQMNPLAYRRAKKLSKL